METLRHTGVRIEEMVELTQLSMRHDTSQTTGTLVPLLHIVPSKTDAERLLPMSPELVTVLLAVQRRAKAGGAPVPLSIRYDPIERPHSEPFPHLFARRVGTRQEVISYGVVRRLLGELAADAGLTDAGQPIRFTPHDFRRLFTTEMVSSGLPPLHIAATLDLFSQGSRPISIRSVSRRAWCCRRAVVRPVSRAPTRPGLAGPAPRPP
ncbi:hypothetical protein GCM10029976_091440 [Kribbella albertanoniae]|uniref:tyrosine-type recombinase/integrase n=1 Tax=Kribbella albertanoniae TaxID=1266829 RepID=UPI00192D68FB|nr:tyrosine-type recombinase/integrase [Kribbella albertanoniae]